MRIGTLFGLCLVVSGILIGGVSLTRIGIGVSDFRSRSTSVDLIRTYGEALVVLELLALERGPINANLGDVTAPDAVDQIRRRGRSVDEALEALHRGVVNRQVAHAEELLPAIDRLARADRMVREAVIELITTEPSRRPAGSAERLLKEILAIPRDGQNMLTRIEEMAVDADNRTGKALRIVRGSAELREAASQLSTATTAAHVGGRRFTPEETILIDRLRGRFDTLRGMLESLLATVDDREPYATAWTTAQAGFFRQGLVWIDEIITAGRTDGEYPLSKEAQVKRLQPTLQSLLALRDATLDIALRTAQEGRESALVAVVIESSIIVIVCFLLAGVAVLLRLRIVRPLLAVSGTIGALVSGQRSVAIPYIERNDEIGDIARALRILRDQAAAADRAVEQTRRWERNTFDEAMRAREEASAASRNKSLFLAGMSHELRTPLNAIVGFAELMHKEMFGPLGDRYRGYAGDILASGIHLLSLVNRILDLSKVEAGAFKPSEAPVSVRDAILHCVTLVELNARAHDIELSTHIAEDLPLVRGDGTALRQIVTNILANAVKFTDAGGSVDISAERTADGGVSIGVVDTGVGMSEEDLKLALVPFARADTPLTRRREGTGLGLPLAKLLTETIGADFAITSRPGVGTAVSITFPATRIVMGSDPRINA